MIPRTLRLVASLGMNFAPYMTRTKFRRVSMPYISTRRLYNVVGKKVSRYLNYRRAKRLYNEINRDMAFFESRFIKTRLHHT
jgi:hypothetical protein